MIARVNLLRKKEDMSAESFQAYWKDTHAPLVAALPGLANYEQNLVYNSESLGVQYNRGSQVVDGFSQEYYGDFHDFQKALEQDEKMQASYKEFTQNVDTLIVVQRVVVPVRADLKLIKRMSFLRRGKEIDAAGFHHEWFEVHGDYVSKVPGFVGYRQNLILDRQRNGKSVPHAELPVDGIVELWFTGMDELNAAYDSDEYRTCLKHGATFLSEITSFLVENEVIKA